MDQINGVTIEKYAELCALMADTAGDESKEISISEAQGVSAADWKAAKTGFTAKMSDPTDMGKTAMAFMPFYQAAQAKMRGGKEPCSLETYTKIHAEMAFKKDPNDANKQIDYMVVLSEHGFTHQQWIECEGYWTPKVGDSNLSSYDQVQASKFRELMQQESDRLSGIQR